MTKQKKAETKTEKRRLSKTARMGIVLAELLLAVILIGLFLRVEELQIEGNEYYSDDQIEEQLFPDDFSRSPLLIWLNQRLGRNAEIPFVQKYSIRLTGLTSAKIIVYEKSLVGYVEFMGSCLYFDKDGMVVESSQEHYGSVPQVTGLDLDYVVLLEKLPVEDDTIFQELLQMSQYFSSREIVWGGETRMLMELVDRIHFDSANAVSCYIGDLVVSLGGPRSMEGKLQEMTDILPQLMGRKGTLHLETYDETLTNPTYIFKNQE